VILSLAWDQWVLGFSLTMPRFLAAFSLLPFFSRQVIPGMLRTGVAISMCLLMVPLVIDQMGGNVRLDAASLFVLIFKEVLVGLMIGFPLAGLFWAVEGIGFYIDNQRGSAMASSADPLTGTESTPLGILFTQAFTVYFMSSGAFLLLLGAFYQTYQFWPVANFAPALGTQGPVFYLNWFDKIMRMIVVLSAPLIIAMFLAEFALALVSRFAPQLNVFFLAMPIKSALAVLMLIFYGPILFGDLMTYDGGLEAIWRAVREVLQ
jgi:type III secretion protein T